MDKYLRDFFSIWKQVFRNWKYSLLAVSIMAVFYAVNVFISEYQSIIQFYRVFGFFGGTRFFLTLIFGFQKTILFSSAITLWTITILVGLLFSLIAYKTIMIKSATGTKSAGFIGTVGIFFGIIAPGCAACGLGLISLLGISAASISFLPYEGLEISWLAIGILGFSVWRITTDIRRGIVCEILKKHNVYKT